MIDTYKISKMENLSHLDLMVLIGVIQKYSNFHRDHEIALVENAFFDFIADYFSDERGHDPYYRSMWINDGPMHDRFDEFGWWRGGYGVLFGWSKIVEAQGFAEIYNPKRWDGSTYKGPTFVSSHWTRRDSVSPYPERDNSKSVQIVELDQSEEVPFVLVYNENCNSAGLVAWDYMNSEEYADCEGDRDRLVDTFGDCMVLDPADAQRMADSTARGGHGTFNRKSGERALRYFD